MDRSGVALDGKLPGLSAFGMVRLMNNYDTHLQVCFQGQAIVTSGTTYTPKQLWNMECGFYP